MAVSTKAKGSQALVLSSKVEQAAILLASGKTGREVAKELGIAAETLSRWKSTPEFQAVANRYRHEYLEAARDASRAAVISAFSVLVEIMQDSTQAAGDRIKAASKVLDVSNLHDQNMVLTCGLTSPEAIKRYTHVYGDEI